jgi:hypothetical protein
VPWSLPLALHSLSQDILSVSDRWEHGTNPTDKTHIAVTVQQSLCCISVTATKAWQPSTLWSQAVATCSYAGQQSIRKSCPTTCQRSLGMIRNGSTLHWLVFPVVVHLFIRPKRESSLQGLPISLSRLTYLRYHVLWPIDIS